MVTNPTQEEREQRLEEAEDDVVGFHCEGGCPQPPPAPEPPPGGGGGVDPNPPGGPGDFIGIFRLPFIGR